MDQKNKHVLITATAIGVVLGAAGIINHGIFEILQGNTRTPGLFIEAIGVSHRFWLHGTEGAITVIPNFLITGIFASLVGLSVILWSLKFFHGTHGSVVFVLLLVLLTLVGGGLGHILLFVPTWLYSTVIQKPLTWWKKAIPMNSRPFLGVLWKPALVLTILSWVVVMELGIFGWFPGLSDPDTILSITFGFVLLTVLLSNLTFISAITLDIEETTSEGIT